MANLQPEIVNYNVADNTVIPFDFNGAEEVKISFIPPNSFPDNLLSLLTARIVLILDGQQFKIPATTGLTIPSRDAMNILEGSGEIRCDFPGGGAGAGGQVAVMWIKCL